MVWDSAFLQKWADLATVMFHGASLALVFLLEECASRGVHTRHFSPKLVKGMQMWIFTEDAKEATHECHLG